MKNLLVDGFADKLEYGEREIDFYLSVPGIGLFGISYPHPLFWVQMSLMFVIQSILNIVVATVIYYLVVSRRKSASTFLVGYGLVIPALLVSPFYLISALDIRNVFLRIGTAACPLMSFFRCMEAMHGTTPASLERTLFSYILYYLSPAQLKMDLKTGKTILCTRRELLLKAGKLVRSFMTTTILFSILQPNDYAPFPEKTMVSSILAKFFWGNLINNYLVACLFAASMEVGGLLAGLGIGILTGASTIEFFDAPLTASTSPSDFWTKRWNRQVHQVLKRGVFLPTRRHASKTVATLVTFGMSGLVHEYLLAVLGAPMDDHPPYRIPDYGMPLAFFLWNGIVLLLEQILGQTRVVQDLRKSLPKPFVTVFVLLTVLPVANWFTDEYIANGFFQSYSLGFPRIVQVE